jgi:hypothetical protein
MEVMNPKKIPNSKRREFYRRGAERGQRNAEDEVKRLIENRG